MKRFISIMSVISLLTAAIALVLNIKVLFGGSIMFGFMMFSMIRTGSFMGYIGNLLGLLITVAGFGAMGLFGALLSIFKKESARRGAFLAGISMTVLALISMIFSIKGGIFTMGDIIILLLPALFTFFIVQTTE
ncbi:MAG: hypothetical protein ACI4KA_03875 [Oscillospiraceae bacterium]